MKRRIALLGGVLCGVSLLAGCGKNPLTQGNLNQNANILKQAAGFADAHGGYPSMGDGGQYAECLAGVAEPILCSSVYKAMLAYPGLKKAFPHLSVKQLGDPTLWGVLRVAYMGQPLNVSMDVYDHEYEQMETKDV